jgi:hypothetical protein
MKKEELELDYDAIEVHLNRVDVLKEEYAEGSLIHNELKILHESLMGYYNLTKSKVLSKQEFAEKLFFSIETINEITKDDFKRQQSERQHKIDKNFSRRRERYNDSMQKLKLNALSLDSSIQSLIDTKTKYYDDQQESGIQKYSPKKISNNIHQSNIWYFYSMVLIFIGLAAYIALFVFFISEEMSFIGDDITHQYFPFLIAVSPFSLFVGFLFLLSKLNSDKYEIEKGAVDERIIYKKLLSNGRLLKSKVQLISDQLNDRNHEW